MMAPTSKPPTTSKCWMVFTKSGIDRIVKTKAPTLKAHERCIELTLVFPGGLFDPAPIIKATVDVPDTGAKVHKVTLIVEE